MQYQVPHFLETEQRIWGPFTFANIVTLLGAAAFLAILYFLDLNIILWIAITVLVVGSTLALMFGSYNGRPLHEALTDFFKHIAQARRRTWAGVKSKESVTEFLLTKEELRKLPSVGAVKKDEQPLSQRIGEISKALDER